MLIATIASAMTSNNRQSATRSVRRSTRLAALRRRERQLQRLRSNDLLQRPQAPASLPASGNDRIDRWCTPLVDGTYVGLGCLRHPDRTLLGGDLLVARRYN